MRAITAVNKIWQQMRLSHECRFYLACSRTSKWLSFTGGWRVFVGDGLLRSEIDFEAIDFGSGGGDNPPKIAGSLEEVASTIQKFLP